MERGFRDKVFVLAKELNTLVSRGPIGLACKKSPYLKEYG